MWSRLLAAISFGIRHDPVCGSADVSRVETRRGRRRIGTGNGHRLINETSEDVVYLEIGDRAPGDEVSYPDDDLEAMLVEGKWVFAHKDGTPYQPRSLASTHTMTVSRDRALTVAPL